MAIELPELVVPHPQAWREWLDEHHADSPGVRLVLGKKDAVAAGAAPTSLSHGTALPSALCFGWIDGQAGSRDDATYTVRFLPRRKRSTWSKRNVEIVAQLTAAGLMRPAGQAQVDAAKADGRWDAAYGGAATIEVPPELAAALAASAVAAAAFERLSSANRFAILFRLANAKRAETRTRNIAAFVAMLERGETQYPQKRSLLEG